MAKSKFIRLTPNELDILQVLIASVSEVYGLAIFGLINDARNESDFNKVGYGSFYAALKKLEKENLIISSTPDKDKRKKHYKITALGEDSLEKNIKFINGIREKLVYV